MTNSFLRFFALFLLIISLERPALAQSCAIDFESIFRFRETEAGSYNVWDTYYGAQDRDEIFKGAVINGAYTIVVGEQWDREGARLDHLILASFDRRGRAIWERHHSIRGLQSVKQIFRLKKGYLVVGDQINSNNLTQIWFGFFDEQGRLSMQKDMAEPEAHTRIQALEPRGDRGGYWVAAEYEEVLNQKDRFQGQPEAVAHAILYEISDEIEIEKRSAFYTGRYNRLSDLKDLGQGYFAAVGTATSDDGRDTGWILHFGPNNTVVWQREYPRGAGAELMHIDRTSYGDLVVGGVAQPLSKFKGHPSGWVMVVDDGTGEIFWQRYYSGDLSYDVRDLYAHEDGQISVLINAESTLENEQDFVRLLTLDPRGSILISDSYFQGEAAEAFEIVMGPVKERILIGSSRMKYTIEGLEFNEDQIRRSRDGWVVAGASADIYEDPCR